MIRKQYFSRAKERKSTTDREKSRALHRIEFDIYAIRVMHFGIVGSWVWMGMEIFCVETTPSSGEKPVTYNHLFFSSELTTKVDDFPPSLAVAFVCTLLQNRKMLIKHFAMQMQSAAVFINVRFAIVTRVCLKDGIERIEEKTERENSERRKLAATSEHLHHYGPC